MPALLRRQRPFSLKVAAAFLLGLTALVAQDPTSYLTPDVQRVGDKLACRCGGCRNTVGNCPMIHCSSADPKRHKIYELKKAGYSDAQVVDSFVKEEGAVTLSSPPMESFGGLVTWVMPGIALLIGLWIYMRFVRGNQQAPAPLTDQDRAAMERFKDQIEGELDEPANGPGQSGRR